MIARNKIFTKWKVVYIRNKWNVKSSADLEAKTHFDKIDREQKHTQHQYVNIIYIWKGDYWTDKTWLKERNSKLKYTWKQSIIEQKLKNNRH